MSLKGRVAVVTGAASGIGRGIAERLIEEGMSVALVDRDESVGAVAQRLEAGPRSGAVLPLQADVSDGKTVAAAFDRILSELGTPWLLVNSAGVYAAGPTVGLAEADWDRVLAVDLKGVFLCSQAALGGMLAAGKGRIVTISSIAGRIARPNQIAYCAAKAGADHFTRCLAIEVAGRGVTVNAVAPGMTRSAMLDAVIERSGSEERLLALIPDGRFAEIQDHAATVVWLASDQAAHVTGQIISVDGGQSLYAPIATGPDRASEETG